MTQARCPTLLRLAPAVAMLVLLFGALPARAALFGSDGPLRMFAPAADATAKVSPDYGVWNRFLQRYLAISAANGVNLVRYADVTADDRKALEDWLKQMQTLDPRDLSRDAQMAWWINLYNAITVDLILAHPGIDSIRDISSGLFSRGPWDMEVATVRGQPLSLNDIEHRILRPLFGDPRVHFAVNCASMGCPNLAGRAYDAAHLEAMLDDGARTYINHPRGLHFEDGVLHLSSIFDWYRGDFPAGEAAFMRWLAGYARTPLAGQIRSYRGSIEYAYDWSLNAAP